MWDLHYVQFARLLDEINAVGLTKEQTELICASMDVKPEDLTQLLGRATTEWDKMKLLVSKKIPLTEEQITEELAENGKIEAVITMDFEELIGQLDESSLDNLFDDMAERVTGNIVGLQDIEYNVLFAEGDTLFVKITGASANEEEDADEEEDEDFTN